MACSSSAPITRTQFIAFASAARAAPVPVPYSSTAAAAAAATFPPRKLVVIGCSFPFGSLSLPLGTVRPSLPVVVRLRFTPKLSSFPSSSSSLHCCPSSFSPIAPAMPPIPARMLAADALPALSDRTSSSSVHRTSSSSLLTSMLGTILSAVTYAPHSGHVDLHEMAYTSYIHIQKGDVHGSTHDQLHVFILYH